MDGREALEEGEPEEALAKLTSVLEGEPSDSLRARVLNDRGVVHLRRGDSEQAALDFEASRRVDEKLAAPVYNLAVLHYQEGRLEPAEALFEQAATLAYDPTDARALEYLALIEHRRGNPVVAETRLMEAMERHPGSPRIRSALAEARLMADEPGEAVEYLLGALEADPAYAPAYFNLAVIHETRLADPDSAAHYYRQFIGQEPEPGPALTLARERTTQPTTVSGAGRTSEPGGSRAGTESGETRASEQGSQRTSSARQGRDDSSGTHRATTPPREPDTVEGHLARARTLAGADQEPNAYRSFLAALALAQAEGRGDPEMEKILQETVAACPRQPGAHYNFGLFLAERKRNEEGLACFRNSVALSPQSVPGYLGMAQTAVRTGQDKVALLALNRALRLEPDHPDALWGVAGLYDQNPSQSADALDAYRRFAAQHRDDPRAAKARERIQALTTALPPETETTRNAPDTPDQDRTRSANVPEQTQPTAPQRPRTSEPRAPGSRNTREAIAAFNRGNSHQARNEWDQAVEQYAQAVQHDPTMIKAHYNLGVAYHRLGKPDQAQAAYETCIRLDPCYVNGRYNLALLHREEGEPRAAVEQLGKLLACDARQAKAHYVMGLIYADAAGGRDVAIQHFRQFLRLSPQDPAAPQVREWLTKHP